MTPTRLRQIATRIETVCVEKRSLLGEGHVACDGCRADARELREFAQTLEKGAHPSESKEAISANA